MAFATARRPRASLGVLIMDIDRSDDVDDTLGHPIGDLLPQRVAERMVAPLERNADTDAWPGGD